MRYYDLGLPKITDAPLLLNGENATSMSNLDKTDVRFYRHDHLDSITVLITYRIEGKILVSVINHAVDEYFNVEIVKLKEVIDDPLFISTISRSFLDAGLILKEKYDLILEETWAEKQNNVRQSQLKELRSLIKLFPEEAENILRKKND
jgi:hypothetical protein